METTRRISASTSPEFEFWMVRNPSFPQPNLVSADELFVDGILLPMQLLHLQNQSPKLDPPDPPQQPHQTHQVPAATTSKRWTDIFKKASSPSPSFPSKTQGLDDKLDNNKEKEKEKSEKKKDRKSQTTATSAELNINLWPFSRSRSAGNSGARPRMFPGTRKVNSAPCSRSNSAGDSKSRKWPPSSPGRTGVHLGRSSPVWQVRRGGSAGKSSYVSSDHQFTATTTCSSSTKKESRRTAAGGSGMNSKTTTQVVNLNGPMCTGYRQHLSYRRDGGSSSGNVGSGNSLFNIRSLFSKKVTVKFQISPTCDVPQLIANLVSNLGVKVDEHGGGSDMLLLSWDSAVAWQLTLRRPEKQKSTTQDKEQSVEINTSEGDLCVLLFRSVIITDKPEIEFMKSGSFSTTEIDALVSSLQLAGGRLSTLVKKPGEGSTQMPSTEKSVSALESMGVKIYGLSEPLVNSSNNNISWDNIAGYDQQKREIEDTILLALHSPDVYDDIACGTRQKFESNRPRAVLFEGPPGTGKTSCARVVANQAGVPLLYVPLEVVVSKYYGESERLLGKVFSLANELPNGGIIFLDEVDAFAIARDTEMHEATRRISSVLLRQIDGFEQTKKVVVAATNRKQDLDPALISRFDAMIAFGLPDQLNRQKIIAQYAKHLTQSETEEFAKVTEGMSGRDIRDVCQQAERSWASKIIRGQTDKGEQICLPPLPEYIESAVNRQKALTSVADQRERSRSVNSHMSGSQMDLC